MRLIQPNNYSLFLKGGLTVVFVLSSFFSSHANSSNIPTSYELGRYTALWEKSPFILESKEEEAVKDETWSLSSISLINEKPFVSFRNLETKAAISLSPGESRSGITLKSAAWNPDYRKSEAIIEVGGETKKITFNEDALRNFSAGTASPSPLPRVTPANNASTPTNTIKSRVNRQGRPPVRRIIRRPPVKTSQ